MSDEFTRAEPQDSVCDCHSSAWVCRTSGWYCCHCGRWQCSITGRVSVRDPEPFQHYNPFARGHTKPFDFFGADKDPVITYDLSHVEVALFEAFTNKWEPDPDSDG